MSTTIKARCSLHGDVELAAEVFEAFIHRGSFQSRDYYTFPCKGHTVEKPADEEIIALLVSGGVRVTVVHIPAEVLEIKDGPVINLDDVLDFHLALERTDIITSILYSEGR